MRGLMLLAVPALMSSAANADTLFDGGHINRDGNDAGQTYFEKAADRFGNCVVKRQPATAASFVDRASAERRGDKPPALADAVNACLPARSHTTYPFIVREQDVAILRAVRRLE